jgi:hypothetical protein
MGLQNRVRPDGELEARPERGSLMGNRGGRIHDPATQSLTSRRWVSRRWICCLLEFNERRRQVWSESYTELFFLDEITALAAGHRPCYECRRTAANAFALAVARSDGLRNALGADALDRRLHMERLEGREKRLHKLPFHSLPDGAMILHQSEFFAVAGSDLLRWTPRGYASRIERPGHGTADTITPPTAIAALASGYKPHSAASTDRDSKPAPHSSSR